MTSVSSRVLLMPVRYMGKERRGGEWGALALRGLLRHALVRRTIGVGWFDLRWDEVLSLGEEHIIILMRTVLARHASATVGSDDLQIEVGLWTCETWARWVKAWKTGQKVHKVRKRRNGRGLR